MLRSRSLLPYTSVLNAHSQRAECTPDSDVTFNRYNCIPWRLKRKGSLFGCAKQNKHRIVDHLQQLTNSWKWLCSSRVTHLFLQEILAQNIPCLFWKIAVFNHLRLSSIWIKPVVMEVNTGASFSLMSQSTFRNL